jgi:tetratricopeptide (TPR) repeat protein
VGGEIFGNRSRLALGFSEPELVLLLPTIRPGRRCHASALALDPHFREGQFLLAYAYLREARYPEAIAQLQELPDGPYNASKWGALGEAYACSGAIEKAHEALGKIDELARTEYVSPIIRGSIYAGLEDWTRVFEQSEQAYVEHTPWLSTLKVDPRYGPIRPDPRIGDLLRRMNLVGQVDNLLITCRKTLGEMSSQDAITC